MIFNNSIMKHKYIKSRNNKLKRQIPKNIMSGTGTNYFTSASINQDTLMQFIRIIQKISWDVICDNNKTIEYKKDIFNIYQLFLNPFKYNINNIIYINTIYSSDPSDSNIIYIELLHENLLFKIPVTI